MKKLSLIIAMLMLALPAHADFWGYEDARKEFHGKVWEFRLSDFGSEAYRRGVNALLQDFESTSGRSLVPGQRRLAGIKVYTSSGAGLGTPHALTNAVIDALLQRGFDRSELLIIDARESRMRESGYLPPLSRRQDGAYYNGVRVLVVDEDQLRDPVWYYDNPLPRDFASPLNRTIIVPEVSDPNDSGSRRSYLPKQLLTDVDFWINLPMVTDHTSTDVNGALANATLWNITNRNRFFTSPANAPVAVAEIAAIPELSSTWALTILSLERYQYIAGPTFNSLYTFSEPLLWLAVDPVILDALMVVRLNRGRIENGFQAISELPPMLQFATELGMGFSTIGQAKILPVEAP